jgi:hypothetical protein
MRIDFAKLKAAGFNIQQDEEGIDISLILSPREQQAPRHPLLLRAYPDGEGLDCRKHL